MKTRLVVGIAAAIALALLTSNSSTDATTWRPSSPQSVLSTNATGAHPDIITNFNIPSPDANFATPGVIGYTDGSFTIANGDPIPDGAIVGNVTATATLGLGNNTCATDTPVTFTMQDGDTDPTDTIAPGGPPDNRLANMGQDNRGATPGSLPNGLPDYLDATPTFNVILYTPAGGGTPLTPVARYANMIDVAALKVLLQLVVFSPGDLTVLPNHQTAIAALGWPSFTILQDPVSAPSNSSISDFCTPLTSTITLFGTTADNPTTGTNEAGFIRITSPAAARTTEGLFQAVSYRDADNDGIENQLDPCPTTANAAWDPRGPQPGPEDTDGDGLPNACDPAPGVLNRDQDGDLWLNRIDNCPNNFNGDAKLTASFTIDGDANPDTISVNNTAGFIATDLIRISTGSATSEELRTIISKTATTFTVADLASSHTFDDLVTNEYINPNVGQNDQDIAFPANVPDEGPRADGIGPECDPTPGTIGVGGGTPSGHYHRAATLSRNCIGGTDADTDGVCASGGGGLTDPNDANPDVDGDGIIDGRDDCISVPNPPPSGFTQGDVDLDGLGDACDPGDFDLDNFTDRTEFRVGTDPAAKCPTSPTHNAWPADINNDTFSDGTDLVAVAGSFGLAVPQAPPRHNVAPDPPDGFVDGTDLIKIANFFGQQC